MRNILLALILMASFCVEARIQMMDGPVGIGDRVKPDGSVLLHLRSTTKGFKVPEMTTAQRDAIALPDIGLEIFNLDNNQKEIYDGLTWTSIGTGNSFFRVTQVGHGRPLGYTTIPVYLSGGVWTDAQADAAASLGTHVIVQVLDVDNFIVAQAGRYEVGAHGLTVESHYFVSELSAGVLTLLEPPVYSNPIVFVENASVIHVMPFRAESSTGSPSPSSVTTVFGRAGNVVAVAGDYEASEVTNVPSGDIVATDVQAAINELDTEKQPLNSELGGIGGLTTTGLVTRTAADTYVTRAVTAGSTKVTVADGDGVAGAPTIDIVDNQIDHDSLLNYVANEHIDWTSATDNFSTTGTADTGVLNVTGTITSSGLVNGRDMALDGGKLDGIEAGADITDAVNVEAAGAIMDSDFISDGLMVRNALGTYTNRTIVAGSGTVVVTNGDGVLGNPEIDVDETLIDHDLLTGYVANEHIDHSTISVDVSASNDGISGGGDLTSTINLLLDINSLAPETVLAPNDEFVMYDLSVNDLKKVTVATLDARFAGGEANTTQNQGGGEGLAMPKSGIILPFKSLIGGTNISLSSTANEVTIDSTAENNTASNLVGGEGVFSAKVGSDLQFKSLVAGTNMGIVSAANTLTLNATGEANTGSSLGGDEAVFSGKVLQNLEFKGLSAGSSITLTPTANDITIATSAQNNTGSSLGGDEAVFSGKVASDLQFKGLSAGSAITLTPTANDITIATSAQNNTGSSLGGDEAVFAGKVSSDLQFKGLTAGSGVTLTPTANDITISVAGGGVTSVFGRSGAVVAVASDYDAVQVDNTPAGTITSTNVQAALNELDGDIGGKQDTITGAATTITAADLTANRALLSDGSGKVAASTVTSTELGYVSGATSNLQSQIDALGGGGGFPEFTIIGGTGNVGANTTVAVSMGNNAANGGMTALRNGEIVGITVRINNTRSGGTLTASAVINGVVQNGAGEETVLDAVNTQGNFQVIASPIQYNAGDNISMQTLTSGWAPTGADAVITLFVRDR